MSFKSQLKCPRCLGVGTYEGFPCPPCGGTGYYPVGIVDGAEEITALQEDVTKCLHRLKLIMDKLEI